MSGEAAGTGAGAAPSDPAAAIASLLPALRRLGRRGLIGVAASGGAGLALAVVLAARDSWGGAAAVVLFAGLGAILAYELTRRAQEALVMPALAGALGLAYRQDDVSFLDALPPRLLPAGARRRVDDVIEGRIAGRDLRFGEVTIATGGKNSRTLFRGIVAALPLVVPIPPFFAAIESETRGWLGFAGRIPVDGLLRQETRVTVSGETLGIWLEAGADGAPALSPALGAVLDVLAGLETRLGGNARLSTAACDGRMLHVALRLPDDLFRIDNPFAGEGGLVAAISRAFADLEVPVRLVAALLEAEAAGAGAGPRA